MRFYLKFIIFTAVFFALNNSCLAQQIRIIVAPVNIETVNSAVGLYPNISDFIANDIINNLNKNLLFDAPGLNSTENLIMTSGLWNNYREFLKNYKNRGLIDYKICDLLHKKLGVQKILLISSTFSMQSMVFKRPFLYKLGLTSVEPAQSFYRLDVVAALVDAQSGIVEFNELYKKNFKVKNFEIPSNLLSDNIVSTEKIKDFSVKISELTSNEVFAKASHSAYANVRSNIVLPAGEELNPMEGESKTMDGHLSSDTNENVLMNKRKDSFKNWVRERIDF